MDDYVDGFDAGYKAGINDAIAAARKCIWGAKLPDRPEITE